MLFFLRILVLSLGIASGSLAGAPAALARDTANAPRIVVSIKPLHSIVAGVTQGIVEPELLIDGRTSPHHFVLRPSAARLLEEADLIVWIGPELETALARPVANIAGGSVDLQLLRAPGVELLANREWDDAHDEHDDHAHHDEHKGHDDHDEHRHGDHDKYRQDASGGIDPHIWLDPVNARAAARAIAEALAEIDPANAARYRANAAALDDELAALTRELQTAMRPVSGQLFLAYHDAFRYFENRFGVEAVSAVLSGNVDMPGARAIAGLRERLAGAESFCVFTEPQLTPTHLPSVIDMARAEISEFDPLGAALPAGKSLYFALLRNLGMQMISCIKN